MILDIHGFWATDDPEVLTAFLTKASARYTALEQALEPIQNVVSQLEPDWQPRDPAYWRRVMGQLTSLRQAVQACCSLFEREQSSQECPVPIAMVGHALRYRCSLSPVEREIEEVGILLTSHSAAPYSLEVGHIRQRQQVFKALRALCEAGQKAIAEGRAGLDALPAEQQEFTSLCQPTRVKCRAGRRQARSRARRPALRLVGGGEAQPHSQEEEALGTVSKGEDS